MNTNLSSGKFDLGALASCRRVTAKLAGETPALPGATSGSPPPIVIFTGPNQFFLAMKVKLPVE